MLVYKSDLRTPMGLIQLYADEDGIAGVLFNDKSTNGIFNKIQSKSAIQFINRENDILKLALQELDLYFKNRTEFFNVPLSPRGTPFQKRVWQNLQEVPYGQTWSYQQLSEMIGSKKSVRAVANAVGQNPIPIIIPCHRIIRKNGSMGGYSAGIDIKKKLLQLEGAVHL